MPGKRGVGPSGWTIQVKLDILLWLGILKHKKNFINGIPKGFETTHELRNAERPRALPPSVIHYVEKHVRNISISILNFVNMLKMIPILGELQLYNFRATIFVLNSICFI